MWVLDTETKGTGAQMVPLEKVLRQPASEPERRRARPLPKPRPQREAPEPVPPRRFRVIDALSRQVLADDANAPETLEVLRGVAQPVDVSIYVWEPRAAGVAAAHQPRAEAALGVQGPALKSS